MFTEDWSSGMIEPEKWYLLRKKWGEGNHGVVPENVRIQADVVHGQCRNVLVCKAHGDRYDGPVSGFGGAKTRVGRDHDAVYCGEAAIQWIDGQRVGENRRFVPAMAAQLNLGIWLPRSGGPAAWQTAQVAFATIKVWQYDDPGDVRGVLTEDITDSFDSEGRELR